MTGDALTTLEYVTRQAQMALRHPLFLVAFNFVTLTLMALGWREQWNYFASWLAIMVEWIVGTYMFGQTKRDALALRETRALAQQMSQLLSAVLRDVEQIEGQIEDEQRSGVAVGEERTEAGADARDEAAAAQRLPRAFRGDESAVEGDDQP